MPGWAEKNFQVLARAFEVIGALAGAEAGGLTKRDAFLAVGGLVDKMADIKLKGPAGEALLALGEAVGPQFVCTQLHRRASAHRNPKARPGRARRRRAPSGRARGAPGAGCQTCHPHARAARVSMVRKPHA